VAHRRGRFYPLKGRQREMWLVTSDRTSRVLGHLHFPAGTDLEAVFREITQQFAAAGWNIEQHLPWTGSFYCSRADQRILVSLQPTPPHNPLTEWPLPPAADSVSECMPG
jgi:hypothetical protein